MDNVPTVPQELNNFVYYLPYLRLEREVSVAGYQFWPLRAKDGSHPTVVEPFAKDALIILSSYRMLDGTSLDDGVVVLKGDATRPAVGEFAAVRTAASLLFLAAWCNNDYFPRYGGPYVNSTSFTVVGQSYTAEPTWIAVSSRRRHGQVLQGGAKHGEPLFIVPLQCQPPPVAVVDLPFLEALDRSFSTDSETTRRLLPALPFVLLANTDDEQMTFPAEVILIASAFEQLLESESACRLCKAFAAVMSGHQSSTVAEAMTKRAAISINPDYATAQLQWPVHQKWMEELHQARSHAVHQGDNEKSRAGWDVREHLLMSAFVFPLVVKLLLSREGVYALTESDLDRLQAVDLLLSATDWNRSEPHRDPVWQGILNSSGQQRQLRRLTEQFLAQGGTGNPEPRQ